MAKSGQVPNIDLAALKSGGKSNDELTGMYSNQVENPLTSLQVHLQII
jgi:hypothetical protein